jgi:ABC-2 type transport system permease protein
MRKLSLIAWNEIVLWVRDPITWVLVTIAPLFIVALINSSFGDLTLGSSIPDSQIQVGVVNQDRGNHWGNFGQELLEVILAESDNPSLSDKFDFKLFSIYEIEDKIKAQRMVERGELMAALFIPPNFSETLIAGNASIDIYIQGREEILGTVFKSAVEILANHISTSRITVFTITKSIANVPRIRAQLESGALDETLADIALRAALPESYPIQIQRIQQTNERDQIKLSHYLTATVTIMIVNLTSLIICATLNRDKILWVLQRSYITPTRISTLLAGKAVGIFFTNVLLVACIIGGLAIIEQVYQNNFRQGINPNLFGLCTLILALVIASTGFGTILTGLTTSDRQAGIYGGAVLILMGLIGGNFFPVQLYPQAVNILSRLTFQYWAMDGYTKLAFGGNTLSILPNLVILVFMGILFFGLGGWLITRRIVPTG